jgi:hypothetical protein
MKQQVNGPYTMDQMKAIFQGQEMDPDEMQEILARRDASIRQQAKDTLEAKAIEEADFARGAFLTGAMEHMGHVAYVDTYTSRLRDQEIFLENVTNLFDRAEVIFNHVLKIITRQQADNGEYQKLLDLNGVAPLPEPTDNTGLLDILQYGLKLDTTEERHTDADVSTDEGL